MKGPPIERVVVVGGGTSGWMSAALLVRMLDRQKVTVTLVESDKIGTIGVGEATVPSIQKFNAMLGIDERDFMRKTGATFKLGIEFSDWGQLSERYFHPFGSFGIDRPELKFHQMWLKLRGLRPEIGEIGEYNLTQMAAKLHRFGRAADRIKGLAPLRYAYHIDAALYARYLRNYAEGRGVRRVEGTVNGVNQRPDGFVSTLSLSDGQVVEGDLFIDCTGFRGLLIEDTLKAGYQDWGHWLPCDRAVAMPSESEVSPAPYTRSMADQAGWRWRIPLQHRVGNGHVYCSEYLEDDLAVRILAETVISTALSEPHIIRFRAGHRRKLWDKNVVAVGLAGGFIEPLESTSIHLIQTGISRLMLLFPDKNFNPALIKEFNRASVTEYEQIRDFVILHYKATRRNDTPFWRRVREMDVPDGLKHKLALFEDSGRLFRLEDELFAENSWLAVMLGQGVYPSGYDPVADSIAVPEMLRAVQDLKSAVSEAARSLHEHAAFIHSYCSADSNLDPRSPQVVGVASNFDRNR